MSIIGVLGLLLFFWRRVQFLYDSMQRSVFNCGEESRRRCAHSAWNRLCFSSAMDRHQVLLWLLASWHQPHRDLQCETHFHVQHLLPLSGDHLIKEWRALTSLQCCNIPFISISFWEFVFSKFAIYGGAELFWIFLMFWYIYVNLRLGYLSSIS